MEISRVKYIDLEALAEFNTRIYPEKTIDSKKYLEFWLLKDDAEISDYLVLKDDDGTIRGQILTSPMAYYYNQNCIGTVWLFDLIVDEKLRKTAWGVDLLLSCMETYPTSCSTGSGPTALPLHLKLGNKMLGEIRKYVGIVNPLYLFSSYARKAVLVERYPSEIDVNHVHFCKISKEQLPSFDGPFNEDLFEITRDKNYLKWRFFNDLHQYAFYLAEDNCSFFVVRSILLKGFRVLELVDYRCTVDDANFESIIKAANKVAKAIHLPVIVCGSTLDVFDKVLERHHYRAMGRPRPVIGFVKCKDRKEDVTQRRFCFVTLADSDGETNWV